MQGPGSIRAQNSFEIGIAWGMGLPDESIANTFHDASLYGV